MLAEYNLLDEPWILASDLDGKEQKLSLKEVFHKAHVLKGINGETETQNAAILRLCLAVLHTIIRRYDVTGEFSVVTEKYDAIDRWGAWWNNKQFPSDVVAEYLEKWRDRFFLFSDEYPFYQDQAVGRELFEDYKKVNKKKTIGDVAGNYLSCGKLIGYLSESGNKKRLFRAENQTSISYEEAARWLINFMNVDDKSLKRPTPKVCGSLGEIGCIFAEGKNLFETLMLNLDLENLQGTDEYPWWESDESAGENQIKALTGLAQWYTLPVRRIFLDRQDGRVIGFKAKAGYCFDEMPLFEPMTAWRREKEKNGIMTVRPRKHNAEVFLWRNLPALLTDSDENGKPGIISWISELKNENLLDEEQLLTFRSVGLEYGTMTSSLKNAFSDTVGLATLILGEKEERERNSVLQQVGITRRFAERYGSFAAEVFLASGGDEGEKKSNVTAERKKGSGDFYAAIDLPFRDWLIKVGNTYRTVQEIEQSWWRIISSVSIKLCRQMIKNLPEAAILGRKGYSAAKAYNQYLYDTNNAERLLKGGKK